MAPVDLEEDRPQISESEEAVEQVSADVVESTPADFEDQHYDESEIDSVQVSADMTESAPVDSEDEYRPQPYESEETVEQVSTDVAESAPHELEDEYKSQTDEPEDEAEEQVSADQTQAAPVVPDSQPEEQLNDSVEGM